MSAFEALRLVRVQQRSTQQLDFRLACGLLRRISSSACGLDFEAGEFLQTVVVPSQEADTDAVLFYRECVEKLLLKQRPVWMRMIAYGRGKFVEKLSIDEVQCFRIAGLLESPPSVAVVAWWDKIARLGRNLGDEAKMLQAREAEGLSYEFERQRVTRLGIGRYPVWTAIEDNQAGYDIHSFDAGVRSPVARLIEVKSTTSDPPRIFVSRNEWEQATQFGDSYMFHIWDLRFSTPVLHEFPRVALEAHIPANRGNGLWTDVEIPMII